MFYMVLPMFQSNRALVLVLMMLIPLFYPIQQAEAEARIESQDFEILDRLSDVMGERQAVWILTQSRLLVRPSRVSETGFL